MAVIGILLLVSPNLLLDVFKDIDLPNYPDLSEEFKIEGLVDLSDILKGSSVTLITLGAVIMVLALAGTCSSICGGLCRLVVRICRSSYAWCDYMSHARRLRIAMCF